MTNKERTIIMAYTGICMLKGDNLNIFYEYLNEILGRPIYTHELGNKKIWEEIQIKSKEDFLKLCN